jgi:hypothetical protein
MQVVGEIKNGKHRETGNIGNTRRRKAKRKHNTTHKQTHKQDMTPLTTNRRLNRIYIQ